ncbi:MAG: hypothetical protein LBU88_11085 [Treponema sp.]|jgi:LPS O-antigen subunit length determinant protein (WzzB/FepE family)|nr:hypothetical protein [Treponema sp.]
MNKRIIAISVLLLMMCAMAVSVFAEANYQVCVVYETRGVKNRDGSWVSRPRREEVYVTVTASSVSDAESKAKDLVQAQYNTSIGRILSANAVRM